MGGSRGAPRPPLNHSHVYQELRSLQPPSRPSTLTSETSHCRATSHVFQTKRQDPSTGWHRVQAKPGCWGQDANVFSWAAGSEVNVPQRPGWAQASQDGHRVSRRGQERGLPGIRNMTHRSVPQFPSNVKTEHANLPRVSYVGIDQFLAERKEQSSRVTSWS